SNDVTRLQALVDRKKVVLMETVIRDILRLDDAENEFSSAMASAVTCLSTGMLVIGENVEACIAEEQVQDDAAIAAAQEGVTTAIEEDVQEQSIPSPTPPPHPPQDLPSTSSVQPTPPPSPQP
nr:hypothetical protein [Tanacetum cinerariifolium]